MLYATAFAFIKKNYPNLAAWLQSSIGAPDAAFPDLQSVNADLVIGPASPDRTNLVRGGILVWIASGRPLGSDGWMRTKDEVKKMFIGMKDDELKAYLKSNNEWQQEPQTPVVPARPVRTVQQVSTPVRTAVVQPATRTPVMPHTPVVSTAVQGRRRSAHGPATGQTGGTPANVVPLAAPTATASFSKCLPDQGPGTMTSSPTDLIKQKRKELEALCLYAVGDAKRFNGPKPAQDKEDALRSNENRLKPMKAAEQAAGGVIHYPQSKLKSAYDNTVKAEGAVCTTFALCAAHVLTGGTRQSGKVRVEIIGVARNLGTHMYVVCGRAGKNLADLSTWGTNAVIVDLWAAALNGHKTFDTAVKADSDDWRLKGGPLGQFYDNARADPKESELAREVNTASLDRSKKLAELQRLEEDLKNTPKVFKVKQTELSTKIAALKKELNV
jgi:hypothetical protein